MSALSPSRPSRRAATARRRAVIESSDEEDKMDIDNDAEEEFTPAPRRATRTTRQSTAEVKTPKRTTRSRQSHVAGDDGESTILMPDGAESAQQQSPSKKASPRKRAVGRPSVRANRKQRASTQIAEVKEEAAALPTPEPSATPEVDATIDATTDAPKPASPVTPLSPTRRDSTPLADITEQAINEQPPSKAPEIAHVDPHVTKLEKPMDIVIRTRQAALPKIEEQTTLAARLVITYLVLTNFKSYAGRQEVGPFHASFSSVVGPNGSGKSNVIDSLLFVFGFRASKMRQGKLSALIHNSAAHPDAEFCEVEVHFQEVKDLPDGGHDVIPDSKLVISRRAFKNNSSSYYINGRTSNFTTVTTLLKDRGIDLDHKRFLILQGEVESIAQMKPKAANEHDDGLLEYLEDIIGTSKYKTPIEEAAQEAEQLNEVCAEKNSRVQHVEREKNSLEDKKNRALQYIADENDLAFKKSSLYQVYMQECNDNLEVSKDAAAKVQSQLDEELQKHQGGEEEIKRLEKKYKSGSKEYDALEKRTQALVADVSKLDKESVKLEEKKKFLANKQKKLEKSLQASEFAAKDAVVTIGQCSDDVGRLTAQIGELESQMKLEEEELAAIRQSLQGKTEGLSNEIAVKQKSLEPWNEKINSKKSSMAVAQSELDILRENANAGALAIAEIEAKLVSLKESKSKKEAELSDSRQKITSTKEEVEAVKKQLGSLAKNEPKLRSALSDACQKADEARASLSSSQTQGNVLAGLMHLKESGRISGFHGRLGNLGTIDSKYDIAISTACPSLDNLVVDTVEIGQQCIEYLRKSNLGRAHFILLDRLPHRDLSPIQTPENVPRLFDLVKSRDERFRPAFYSVMQNTLVADNLEQANRIAYGQKRWRVVTLEGQLIDKSGTMSGGGTRVMKGAMSSKLVATVSKDQVSKMEVDRDALERQLQAHLKQQREFNDTLRDLNEQVPQLETMTQKLSMEISSIERNIADAEKRIKEIGAEQNTTQSDKSRMASLEKTISATERDIAKLHSEMASIEEEIKVLQDKIMEIGGVRLRGQKAKVDGLKEQIDTMSSEMSNAEVSKAKAEKNKVKHEKAIAESKVELEKLASDFQKVDEDAKRQRDLVSSSNEALSAAQDVRHRQYAWLGN
jgi:structural maintenance of chromosome 4